MGAEGVGLAAWPTGRARGGWTGKLHPARARPPRGHRLRGWTAAVRYQATVGVAAIDTWLRHTWNTT
ncbi:MULTISPECIES: hypothetical protein [Actinosynnema]|uniref:hypothetical protein n=1 Tax=Actinosynnema TaxID=40566 RepID=UPI0020A5518B|nr:hypothetical protein [Actinosynnema pretiosum]MCP2098922.1 hypothetical protein [Actinosynnema pretiosum]